MRLSISRLLITCFLGYVAYEVYLLYVFCQPPVALEESQGGSVRWDLLDKDPLDICVFVAKTEKPPPSDVARHRRAALVAAGDGKPSQEQRTSRSKAYHLLGLFEAVPPLEADAARSDIRLERLELPESFYNNGTIYLHVVAVPSSSLDAEPVRHEAVRISRYDVQPDRKVRKEYLLGAPPAGVELSDVEVVEAAIGSQPVVSLPRVIEVGFVQENRPLDQDGLHEKGLGMYVKKQRVELPLFVNTLVSPRDEYAPLFKGAKLPSLEIRLRNVGLGYWTLQQQLGMAFDDAEKSMGMNEYDIDSFKQMISGSSPYKILMVYAVALLHLIFEYLAFSSDISFWRAKTSFEGLSSTSVTLQACMNIIMFLYVQEQRQTKFVMYFIAFRFCLQLWKLRKLTTFQRCSGWPFLRWVNRAGADQGLEELQDINDAERRCMRGLLLVLLPVICSFCAYRLIYYRFRSWYSWIVLSLAVCAQMGGFVVMTPQVFMNWRLKSVEHLPWKALTYQAINTFIDDIFMLCIRMPEVQKYSVFRDDIIFVICLVQRWLYRKPEKVATADTAGTAAAAASADPGAGATEATPADKAKDE